MYGYGSLKQRILCLFNWFWSYSKIASKGGVGGLNLWRVLDPIVISSPKLPAEAKGNEVNQVYVETCSSCFLITCASKGMDLGTNFVPLRVGVSCCRPSRGIYFLAEQPPPPRGYQPRTINEVNHASLLCKSRKVPISTWTALIYKTSSCTYCRSTCLFYFNLCSQCGSKKLKVAVQ